MESIADRTIEEMRKTVTESKIKERKHGLAR